MEAAVEALLEFGETRARVVGGEGVRGVSGSGAGAGPPGGGQEQIMRDELLAMQLQEELLREGGRAETPFVGGGEISQALGGLWGSVSAAAADLGNLAVTTGRAVAEGVTSVAGNLMAEGGGGGGAGHPGAGPGAGAGWAGGAGRGDGEAAEGAPLLSSDREQAVERTGLHRRPRTENKKDQ